MAMERTRIAKVEDVTLARRGEQAKGTLHLTPHHLIFVHSPPTASSENQLARPKELWITYPIISFCTLRPSPAASRQPSSIRLRCRDFSFVCFYVQDDRKARDLYESIKAWTCKLGRIEKLYAFTYKPQGPERDTTPSGWAIYDPMREWRRMGVGDESRKLNWRISKINIDYAFSPTYPALLPVPSTISDNTLNHAGRYRSRARIPALTYLHPINNCTITRCSQPMLGVRQNRSIQDETLLSAIFSTTRAERPLSYATVPTPPREESSGSSQDLENTLGADLHKTSTEAMEDVVISKLRGDQEEEDGVESDEKKPMVYGAQQRNMIVDARPTINAIAMQAAGMGSENMDNYKFATKVYLGIDNIHVMRDSLQKVIDTLKDSDLTPIGPNREQLQKSNWLKHIANMLDGVSLIARQVALQHSHVLIHCSDGWDRTSQLSALSQLCLDPYYRTLEGFIVLVEKDWLSYGHQFRYRTGFLNSEKWFNIENERISGRNEEQDGTKKTGVDAMSGAQRTFENAFLSAKGFFTKHNNDSRESINVDSEAEADAGTGTPNSQRVVSGKAGDGKDKPVTKVKETAPIFHQFLDAVWQLMYQHPTRFEFNERFLRRLLYHLYSCQYGTFLFDNERERREAKINERTTSVWNYFLSRKKEFYNTEYDATVDDNIRGKERLIFPRTQEVRWWASVFGRTDDEMNGSTRSLPAFSTGLDGDQQDNTNFGMQSQSMPVSRSRTPVLTGVETSEAAVGVGSPPHARSNPIVELQKQVQETQISTEEERKEESPSNETDVSSSKPLPIPSNNSNNVRKSASFTRIDRHDIIDIASSTPNSSYSVINHTNHINAFPHQEPESKAEQEEVERRTVEDLTASSSTREIIDDGHHENNTDGDVAGDLDPLGIGDVKEHIPSVVNKRAYLDRRREQMEALMQ